MIPLLVSATRLKEKYMNALISLTVLKTSSHIPQAISVPKTTALISLQRNN